MTKLSLKKKNDISTSFKCTFKKRKMDGKIHERSVKYII